MRTFNTSLPLLLKKFWHELTLVFALLKDFISGNYRDVSPRFLLTIAGLLIYLVSPIDLIPDFIPVAGVLDDAIVLKFALDFIAEDLFRYQRWKESVN